MSILPFAEIAFLICVDTACLSATSVLYPDIFSCWAHNSFSLSALRASADICAVLESCWASALPIPALAPV